MYFLQSLRKSRSEGLIDNAVDYLRSSRSKILDKRKKKSKTISEDIFRHRVLLHETLSRLQKINPKFIQKYNQVSKLPVEQRTGAYGHLMNEYPSEFSEVTSISYPLSLLEQHFNKKYGDDSKSSRKFSNKSDVRSKLIRFLENSKK
ncbi:Uncharacterised protein [uncultured archaeon]|nr:Uncharacterised protein [uncultured archaeon]